MSSANPLDTMLHIDAVSGNALFCLLFALPLLVDIVLYCRVDGFSNSSGGCCASATSGATE